MSIDYPTVYVPSADPFPICGSAICGEAKLPGALWAFTLAPADTYKVLNTTIDVQNALITYHLREVVDGI